MTTNTTPATLPATGFSRAAQLLPFLPFKRTTLHEWCKSGRFPAPIKLSANMTAWRNEDVHAWLKAQGQPT